AMQPSMCVASFRQGITTLISSAFTSKLHRFSASHSKLLLETFPVPYAESQRLSQPLLPPWQAAPQIACGSPAFPDRQSHPAPPPEPQNNSALPGSPGLQPHSANQ